MAGGRTQGSNGRLVELRVLDGPNLYFTRPAIKLTLELTKLADMPEDRLAKRAEEAGVRSNGAGIRPGPPGSDRRLRFLARVAAQLTRVAADATGTHIAVRARPGPLPDRVVVAFPWRNRTAAETFANQLAALLIDVLPGRRSMRAAIRELAATVMASEPGPQPTVPEPHIPVIAVTGTNGKTTTVRLLAHLVRAAGKTVAYSSTDGVYLQDRLVEKGDYSGFGGAGKAMSQPGADLAVLETARGGILLRGIGTTHNDVAVVTNISNDHLGMHGIETLDQLAEVKSTILRITKPDGWDVLNADDPRVLAMRRIARGRTWLFSLDPNHPALRSVLNEGGRGMTVLDGAVTVLEPNREPYPLLPVEQVPVTLAGLSSNNVQNALGATAAALAAGIPERAVVQGLRSFVLDPESNPGRANLFEVDRRVVVLDYAHNEAGMAGLVEVARGLRRSGAEVWLTYSSAGDRSDEILHGLGYLAARGADHVAIAQLLHYLRGREAGELIERLRAGAVDGGKDPADVPDFPDEVHALEWMLERSKPNDVVAITALGQRPELFALLERRGAKRVGPARVRQLVRRARGIA
ncbi:MAG TPA: Mur ligase family protein [Actinomycetota bacterium]|nr:Mur ligase family protein [Actinomycetota bacterium]